MFELVLLDPVRPLAKARKKKTKTVKKSLDPDWGESGATVWEKIDEDVAALGLKVRRIQGRKARTGYLAARCRR